MSMGGYLRRTLSLYDGALNDTRGKDISQMSHIELNMALVDSITQHLPDTQLLQCHPLIQDANSLNFSKGNRRSMQPSSLDDQSGCS